MSDDKTDDGRDSGAAAGRKAYLKPAIAWEEPLEDRPNLIAACAQLPGESAACDMSPTS